MSTAGPGEQLGSVVVAEDDRAWVIGGIRRVGGAWEPVTTAYSVDKDGTVIQRAALPTGDDRFLDGATLATLGGRTFVAGLSCPVPGPDAEPGCGRGVEPLFMELADNQFRLIDLPKDVTRTDSEQAGLPTVTIVGHSDQRVYLAVAKRRDLTSAAETEAVELFAFDLATNSTTERVVEPHATSTKALCTLKDTVYALESSIQDPAHSTLTIHSGDGGPTTETVGTVPADAGVPANSVRLLCTPDALVVVGTDLARSVAVPLSHEGVAGVATALPGQVYSAQRSIDGRLIVSVIADGRGEIWEVTSDGAWTRVYETARDAESFVVGGLVSGQVSDFGAAKKYTSDNSSVPVKVVE